MWATGVYAAVVIVMIIGFSEAKCSEKPQTCVLRGDPHFTSYSGAMKGDVPFPCIFLATKSDRFFMRRGFKVEVSVYTSGGINTARGGYYDDWVRVVVDGFSRAGAPRGQKTYTANITSVQNAINNNDASLAWVETGSFTRRFFPPTVNNDDAILPTTKFEFINVRGNSRMSVTFRPRITGHAMVTHYGLNVTLNSALRPPDHYAFPASLCSTFGDTDWNGNTINIGSVVENILYALLDQNQRQETAECIDAFDVFHTNCITPTNKAHAVVACDFYVSNKTVANCLEHEATGATPGDAFRAFRNCMAEDCGAATDADWVALQNRVNDANCFSN